MKLLALFKKRQYLSHQQQSIGKFVGQAFGITPQKIGYYEQAFTHKSVIRHSKNKKTSNERLEFIGDAILSNITAIYLFKKYPEKSEGDLTKLRAKIVSRSGLNRLAKELDLEKHLNHKLGKNDKIQSVLGNALEALIGALYLDQEYKKVKKAIEKTIIEPALNYILEFKDEDYKSRYLEWAQQQQKTVNFNTLEIASNSREKQFKTTLFLNDQLMGVGIGFSKKKAEQKAAKEAYLKLKDK